VVYDLRMLRILSLVLWIVCAVASNSAVAAEHAKAERHVVVVVWDGMRPDFISEQNTPTLWKLSQEGVTFRNHHSVYPSATMVNGTSLATGVYPGRNGIIANHVYRPQIDAHHSIDVEVPAVVKKGDEVFGGKYISVPTIAELVQRAGGRTVIASAKTVGLLLDRQADVGAAKNCITLFAGKSLPAETVPSITATLGPFPSDHLQQDAWTTKALTDCFWKEGVPALSVLWLGEPDLTQHESAPGAPAALAAIKSADENLAAVLSALDQRDARGRTDVFIVSDHGFSTIERSVDLRTILNDAGFTAKIEELRIAKTGNQTAGGMSDKTEFKDQPKPGDIMLAGNGGSVLFYVVGHDKRLIRRLVEFLQQSDFAGVIFTKEPMEGTFGLTQALIRSGDAPDVVMAFRWTDSQNQFGVTGEIDADWQRAAGKGTHATLSRFDMHNTLIAAGPDFKRGQTDDLPTGNVDLVPTILQILAIKVPHQMDGRILSEAVAAPTSLSTAPKPEAKSIEARKDFPSGTWRQTLKISGVGSTIYLDEGNGAFVGNEPAPNESQRNR
jgi:arylsulfatase A-like enzyme